MNGPDEFSAEHDRIRAAYARRGVQGRYAWSDPAYLFLLQSIERRALATLTRGGFMPLRGRRVLDIGCGTGYWLREFIKWGARPEDAAGVDLLPDRIAAARELCPPGIELHGGDAASLPWPDAAFDLVSQFTVFTSIRDPALKARVASEMLRVLRPNGAILWYDFHVNNPRNPDVRGVKRGEIAQLFPNCSVALRRTTLAPPLVRLLAGRASLLCTALELVPPLLTHYLGTIRRS